MASTLQDFIDFTNYQDLDDGEKIQIQKWLLAAEEMILDFTGGEWENSRGSTVIADSRQIIIVRRYFDNQRGLTSATSDGVSEAYDAKSYEGLRLTTEDKEALGRLFRVSKAFKSIGFHKNYGQVW